MAREQKNHFPVGVRYIMLFVLLLALLLAAAGTLAWMRHMRSLQTVTLVQVSDISLVGPTPNTAAIDLGDIDAEVPNDERHREYVFGVKSVNNNTCTIQLAHTTNIKFKYEIYRANTDPIPEGSTIITVEGKQFAYGDCLKRADDPYKNGSDTAINSDPFYNATYNSSDLVQTNAIPLYWQAETTITSNDTSYFILKVIWGEDVKNTKETDMVYLTVGTGGTGEAGEAGGTEQAGG